LASDEPFLWQLTGRGSLHPTADVLSNQAQHASGLHASQLYRVCGRIFGMALINNCKLGRPLARPFARLLVEEPPWTLPDLQAELNYEGGDTSDYRGGRDILDRPLAEMGLAGVLTMTRMVSNGDSGCQVELIPHGSSIEVTDENKERWLTELLRHKLVTSMRSAAESFRDGLMDVFGGAAGVCPVLCLLSADELTDLWAGRGVSQEDVAQWRRVAQVSPIVQRQADWFFSFLEEECDDELRGQILRFVTGASRVGREGVPDFSIEPGDGSDERLPTAMTCGNMLQLPRYSCRAVLCHQVRTAAESCDGFLMT